MSYSLFDIGGTLVDSVTSKKAASYDFIAERRLSVTNQELDHFIENLKIDRTRTRDLVGTLLAMNSINPTNDDYELFRKIERSYSKDLITGSEEYLTKLRDDGHTLAVVTNGKNFNKDGPLFPKGLHDFFPSSNIFYRKSSDVPKKPSPYLYQDALMQLGANPNEVTVYEDTPRGLQAARASGIEDCIGMTTSKHHDSDVLLQNGARETRNNYLLK